MHLCCGSHCFVSMLVVFHLLPACACRPVTFATQIFTPHVQNETDIKMHLRSWGYSDFDTLWCHDRVSIPLFWKCICCGRWLWRLDTRPFILDVRDQIAKSISELPSGLGLGRRAEYLYRHRFNMALEEVNLLRDRLGGQRSNPQTFQLSRHIYMRGLLQPERFFQFTALNPDLWFYVAIEICASAMISSGHWYQHYMSVSKWKRGILHLIVWRNITWEYRFLCRRFQLGHGLMFMFYVILETGASAMIYI